MAELALAITTNEAMVRRYDDRKISLTPDTSSSTSGRRGSSAGARRIIATPPAQIT